MKKEHFIWHKLHTSFQKEKRRCLFAFGLFLLGILAGSFAAATAGGETSAEIQSYFERFFSAFLIQGTAKSEVFRLSLLNYAKLAIWLWSAGWFFWLIPLGILQVTLKGFRTGFTLTYLVVCYRLKGALLAILSILPQNLILIPTLCFYLVCQLQFASDRRHLRQGALSPAVKKQVYQRHLITTALFLALLLLCALIEGYVTPTLVQPLCGLFQQT